MTVTDLLAQMKAHLTSLGTGRDLTTDDARALFWADYNTKQGVITTLMNPPAQKRIDALAEWRAHRDAWLEKKEALTTEIATFKDWRLAGNLRERDAEYERQNVARSALRRLHEGTLYVSPGKTFGTIAELEQRVAELEVRVNREQAHYDAAVAQAERILDAAAQAAAQAEQPSEVTS